MQTSSKHHSDTMRMLLRQNKWKQHRNEINTSCKHRSNMIQILRRHHPNIISTRKTMTTVSKWPARQHSDIVQTSVRHHWDISRTAKKWQQQPNEIKRQQNIIQTRFTYHFKHNPENHANLIQTSFKCYLENTKWKQHQNDSKTSCRHRANIIKISFRYYSDIIQTSFRQQKPWQEYQKWDIVQTWLRHR